MNVVAGDFDGDGIDDLVVSAQSFLANPAGSVLVTFGRAAPDLPWEEYLLLRADLVVESKVDDRNFARALAIGDLDGDGLDDLAAAGYFEDEKGLTRGGVAIYRGDPSRRTAHQLVMETDPPDIIVISSADYDEFGMRLLIDDLDADGAAELIVAAPYAERTPGEMAGRVDVLRGGPDFFAGDLRDLATDPPDFSVAGGEWNGNLGLSLAAGPRAAGEPRLLWVGDPAAWPEQRVNAGMVIGVTPDWTEKARKTSAEEAEVIIYNAEEYWGLGSAVGLSTATDGQAVIWMGAINAYVDGVSGGALLALDADRLAPAGEPTDLAQTIPTAFFYGEADGDLLGNALLIGDLDFSGHDDVAAAAWYASYTERVDAGKVYLFRDPFAAVTPDDDDDDNDDNDNDDADDDAGDDDAIDDDAVDDDGAGTDDDENDDHEADDDDKDDRGCGC